jgi:hypothetical protein
MTLLTNSNSYDIQAGWTPLHYAGFFSPPTLVSYLMTHGCSPFALTERKLTALDIVTAHSTLPGKEDVALLLEEAMRGQGWTGGRMEQKRRLFDQRMKKKGKLKTIREGIGKTLGVSSDWWGKDSESSESDSDGDDEDDTDLDERVYVSAIFPVLIILSDYIFRHRFLTMRLCWSSPLLCYLKYLILSFRTFHRNSRTLPQQTRYISWRGLLA